MFEIPHGHRWKSTTGRQEKRKETKKQTNTTFSFMGSAYSENSNSAENCFSHSPFYPKTVAPKRKQNLKGFGSAGLPQQGDMAQCAWLDDLMARQQHIMKLTCYFSIFNILIFVIFCSTHCTRYVNATRPSLLPRAYKLSVCWETARRLIKGEKETAGCLQKNIYIYF